MPVQINVHTPAISVLVPGRLHFLVGDFADEDSSSIWSMVFSFMALILCRLFHQRHLMQQPANIIPRCTPILARTICPLLFVDRVSKAFERMGQVVSRAFRYSSILCSTKTTWLRSFDFANVRNASMCVRSRVSIFSYSPSAGALWRTTAQGFRISNWTPSFSTGKGKKPRSARRPEASEVGTTDQLANTIMARLQLR
jgi:hypothetical protein